MYIIFLFLIVIQFFRLACCAQLQYNSSNELFLTQTYAVTNTEETMLNILDEKECNCYGGNPNKIGLEKSCLRKIDEKKQIFSINVENHLKIIEETDNISCYVRLNPRKYDDNGLQNMSLALPSTRKRAAFCGVSFDIIAKKLKLQENKPSLTTQTIIFKGELEEKIVEVITEDVKEYFSKYQYDIQFIEVFIAEKTINTEKDIFMKCVDLIVKTNNKYLCVIVQGLTSFLVKIKDNEIKIEEHEYFKMLFYFIVLKELSETLKNIKENCYMANNCPNLKLKSNYVLTINTIHDVFIKMLKLADVKESYILLYELLILVEKRYKYTNILQTYSRKYRYTLYFIFDPIFDIFFHLDEQLIIRMLKKHNICFFEDFYCLNELFFLGSFKEKISKEEINNLIDKYQKIYEEIKVGFLIKPSLFKGIVKIQSNIFNNLRKIYEKNTDDKINFYNKGRPISKIRSYGIFLCSTMIALIKNSHYIHHNEIYYYVRYRQVAHIRIEV